MDGKLYKKTKKVLMKWGLTGEKADDFIRDLTETADDEDENENEEEGKMEVKERIDEAEKRIDEKGKDTQTEKDRIDESVGEQLKDTGDEDSQTAKDRVDESEGEERAEGKERDNSQDDRIGRLEAKLDALAEKLEKVLTGMTEEPEEDEEALKKAEVRYGANSGVFETSTEEPKKMTAKEAVGVFKKFK